MIQFAHLHYFRANLDVGQNTANGQTMLAAVRSEAARISEAEITQDDANGIKVDVPDLYDGSIEFIWDQHKQNNGVAGLNKYFSYGNTKRRSDYYQALDGDFYG